MGMNRPGQSARPLEGAGDPQRVESAPRIGLPGLSPGQTPSAAYADGGMADIGQAIKNAGNVAAQILLHHNQQKSETAKLELKTNFLIKMDELDVQFETDPEVLKGIGDGTFLDKTMERRNGVAPALLNPEPVDGNFEPHNAAASLSHKDRAELDLWMKDTQRSYVQRDFERKLKMEGARNEAIGNGVIDTQNQKAASTGFLTDEGINLVREATRTKATLLMKQAAPELVELAEQEEVAKLMVSAVQGQFTYFLDLMASTAAGKDLTVEQIQAADKRLKNLQKTIAAYSGQGLRLGMDPEDASRYTKAVEEWAATSGSGDVNAAMEQVLKLDKVRGGDGSVESVQKTMTLPRDQRDGLISKVILSELGIASTGMRVALPPAALHSAMVQLNTVKNQLDAQYNNVKDRTLQDTRRAINDGLQGWLANTAIRGGWPQEANEKLKWLRANGEASDIAMVDVVEKTSSELMEFKGLVDKDTPLAEAYDQIMAKYNPYDPRYKGAVTPTVENAWAHTDRTIKQILGTQSSDALKPGSADFYGTTPTGRKFAEGQDAAGGFNYAYDRQVADGQRPRPLFQKQAEALAGLANQASQFRDIAPDKAAPAMESFLKQIQDLAPEKTAKGLQKRQAALEQVLETAKANPDTAASYFALQRYMDGRGTPEDRIVAVQSTEGLGKLALEVLTDKSGGIQTPEGKPRLMTVEELRSKSSAYDAYLRTEGMLDTGLGRAHAEHFNKVYRYNLSKGRPHHEAVKQAEKSVFPNHTGKRLNGHPTLINSAHDFTDAQVAGTIKSWADTITPLVTNMNSGLSKDERTLLKDNLSRIKAGTYRLQLAPKQSESEPDRYIIQVNTDLSGAAPVYRPVTVKGKPVLFTGDVIMKGNKMDNRGTWAKQYEGNLW